jgi:hypothetical protein
VPPACRLPRARLPGSGCTLPCRRHGPQLSWDPIGAGSTPSRSTTRPDLTEPCRKDLTATGRPRRVSRPVDLSPSRRSSPVSRFVPAGRSGGR